MDGFLLIDKPKNWTSFDVVAKIRGIAKAETGIKRFKVGHAGTLDPLATGLLIILLGKYTKRAAEFSKLDKTYEVTACLGKTSTTGDEEGQKTEGSDSQPALQDIQAVLDAFTGEQSQVPPQYSAVKVGGKKAYEIARKGSTVALEPRTITVHEISAVHYDYPLLSFRVSVSSGTYIRSLVEDIGTALHTGAYTTNLRRVSIGGYTVTKALSVEKIDTPILKQNLTMLD